MLPLNVLVYRLTFLAPVRFRHFWWWVLLAFPVWECALKQMITRNVIA